MGSRFELPTDLRGKKVLIKSPYSKHTEEIVKHLINEKCWVVIVTREKDQFDDHEGPSYLDDTNIHPRNIYSSIIAEFRCTIDIFIFNSVAYEPRSFLDCSSRQIELAFESNLMLMAEFLRATITHFNERGTPGHIVTFFPSVDEEDSEKNTVLLFAVIKAQELLLNEFRNEVKQVNAKIRITKLSMPLGELAFSEEVPPPSGLGDFEIQSKTIAESVVFILKTNSTFEISEMKLEAN